MAEKRMNRPVVTPWEQRIASRFFSHHRPLNALMTAVPVKLKNRLKRRMEENMDTTIEELQRKLENDSDNLSFAIFLADAYRKEDKLKEALEVLKSATGKHPSSSLVFFKLGECALELILNDLVEKKKLNEGKSSDIMNIAVASFNRAIQLKPDYIDALNSLATLRILKNEFGEARTLLEKSLDLNPGQPEIVNVLNDLDKKKP